jgi:putative PIG3 family NAD(P)H quinone oxidoreductase
MRAIRIRGYGGPKVLELADIDMPVAHDDYVVARIHAAGLNRGDIAQREGRYPPPSGAPDTPGLEFAGVVDTIGPAVKRWKPGDRVCGLLAGGGYAEYCLVNEGHLLPLPADWSMTEGAGFMEAAATVWANVFDQILLKPGETFLVHGGASGIGTMAIQIGAAIGARVFATANGADRCARCIAIGAQAAIDYMTQDFVTEVSALTRGRGVDVILDMVGGDYMARNIECAAVGGRLSSIAYLRGSEITLDFRVPQRKRLTIAQSTLRARDVAEKTRIIRGVEKDFWPYVLAGQIRPVVASTYGLADAGEAQSEMERGGHFGKIILITGG